jgi:hypothetical protein
MREQIGNSTNNKHGRSMSIYILEVFLISGPTTKEFVNKNPVVSRTIDIRGDQSLEKLHDAIFKVFNREDEHLYEFQIGGKGPNDPKAKRYGLTMHFDDKFEDIETEGDVTQTKIDTLNLKKDEAFGYWFDFGDDWWHQINVISIENKSLKSRYPKITNRIGQSPPQYIDIDE